MNKQLRINNTRKSIKKQLTIAKNLNIPVLEQGRLKKCRLLNCGQSGCPYCGNPRRKKANQKDLKTIQELSSEELHKLLTKNNE